MTVRSGLTRGDRPLRVLIVEDHAVIALDLQFMIDDLRGEVIGIVASGEDAVASTRELRPDIVLMDVRLAGMMDGVDAAAAVAEVPGTALVFVTGNTDPRTMDRIRRLGNFSVVAKPVVSHELLAAIRRACDLDSAPRPCAATVWQISTLPRRPRPHMPRADVTAPEVAAARVAAALLQHCLLARMQARALRETTRVHIRALSALRSEMERRRAVLQAERAARSLRTF